MASLQGKRFLFFVHELYEDLELWYPKLRLQEEGAQVVVAAPELREYRGKHGYPCKADPTLDQVESQEFDGLVIPGGFAPDKLRRYERVLQLVREFHESGKMIAFICHAGWVPISAKILKGRKATSVPAIKDDMINAGVEWIDEAVVKDGNLISSRHVNDLPEFGKAIIKYFT
ncbi:MAG: type 1 glutamine amidotransferase [Calditrichaeota bacterium]|nr:MAG: type 1 glutamine amidotransferase [Calditrichota bacterium]